MEAPIYVTFGVKMLKKITQPPIFSSNEGWYTIYLFYMDTCLYVTLFTLKNNWLCFRFLWWKGSLFSVLLSFIFGFINIRHIHNDKKSDQNYFFKQLWTENYWFVSPNYVNLCMAYLALVVNVIFFIVDWLIDYHYARFLTLLAINDNRGPARV